MKTDLATGNGHLATPPDPAAGWLGAVGPESLNGHLDPLMVRHLCKGFLADAVENESAAARWRRLWDRIVAEEGRQAEWQVPWFAPEFANGTPMRDGNPNFSAVSPTLRRAVRIIRHEPTSDELELEYWLDTFQGDEPISELIVSCALSS